MLKIYLSSILSFFFFCSVSAQKATTLFEKGFEYINLCGTNIKINFLADDKYAIVTNGLAFDELYFSLNQGIFNIDVRKKQLTGSETLVILYPEGRTIPKVIVQSQQLALN